MYWDHRKRQTAGEQPETGAGLRGALVTVFCAMFVGWFVSQLLRGNLPSFFYTVGKVVFWIFILAWCFVGWLAYKLARLLKSSPKGPSWDEIPNRRPIMPEPRFRGNGIIASAISNWLAKRGVRKPANDDPGHANLMGELFEMGTKYTPKDIKAAVEWYKIAAARGHKFAKIRLAEIAEDNFENGLVSEINPDIYSEIPEYPSAMLFSAKCIIFGDSKNNNYVEAYKNLLMAAKWYSWVRPTQKKVQSDVQSYSDNRRHIRTIEFLKVIEVNLSPEQRLRGMNEARRCWSQMR